MLRVSIALSSLCIASLFLVTRADICACTYEGTRPCSASISCLEGEEAVCECTSTGCSSSCSSGATILDQNYVFTKFTFEEMNLEGFKNHVEAKDSNWTVVTRSSLGSPLAIGKIDGDYTNVTLEVLSDGIAQGLGVCVEINVASELITFKSAGTCP